MQEYRVYVIDQDGHIQDRIDLFCADDDAAKERAKLVATQLQSAGVSPDVMEVAARPTASAP